MHRYVIERELPDAGKLTKEQLQAVAKDSWDVLAEMGPGIQWVQSFVVADRIYCVYLAENEQLLREHAKRAGFPCTRISEVVAIIDPLTAAPLN